MQRQFLTKAPQAGASSTLSGPQRQERALQEARYGPVGVRTRPYGYRRVRARNDYPQYPSARHWSSSYAMMQTRYNRMNTTAMLLGLGNSPFMPRDFSEYLNYVAEKQRIEASRLEDMIEQKKKTALDLTEAEETLLVLSELVANEDLIDDPVLWARFTELAPPQPMVSQLFDGKQMGDGLSAVLAVESCFGATAEQLGECRDVNWPSAAGYPSWKKRGRTGLPPPMGSDIQPMSLCNYWWYNCCDTNVNGQIESDRCSETAEITLFQLRLLNRRLEASLLEILSD